MMKGTFRQVAIVVLTAAMLTSNLLSGQGGGFTEQPGEMAVYFMYPTRFSPAPFTFLIWLPIFIGTVALAVHQALPKQRTNPMLDRMAVPYAIALVANALTPFVDLGVSNLVVLVLFLALVATYATFGGALQDRPTRIFVTIPVAMFATWAGLATIANACQFVAAMGGTIREVTATALVIVAMAIGAWAIVRTKEFVIAAVMAWAAIGLAAANIDAPTVLAALGVTTAITLAVAWRFSAWRTGPISLH